MRIDNHLSSVLQYLVISYTEISLKYLVWPAVHISAGVSDCLFLESSSQWSLTAQQSVLRYQFWQPRRDQQSDYSSAGSRGEISWNSSQWPHHHHRHHHQWQSSSVCRKMMNHNKNVSIQSWNLLSPPVNHSLCCPQPSPRIVGGGQFSWRSGKPQPRPEQYLHGLGQLLLHISLLSQGNFYHSEGWVWRVNPKSYCRAPP